MHSQRIAIDKIRAIILDLDGVITDTATLHIAAWKHMFDQFLRKQSEQKGIMFEPFRKSDYLDYVDGKPRYDGVKDFLASRGISIPYGNERDSPKKKTVCGLGNQKNKYYLRILKEKGPKVYKSSVRFVENIRKRGLGTAIISSSRNCALILRMTNTGRLFDAKVDGNDLETMGIPGKPNPAMFLEAAKRIDVEPSNAAIVEDALAGVEAGRRGNFGLVIGVARSKNGHELKMHGADITATDLKQLKLAGPGRKRKIRYVSKSRKSMSHKTTHSTKKSVRKRT